jgi:lipoprotein-releasing system permease protein
LLPPDEAPPYEKVTIKGLIQTDMQDIDGEMIFYNYEGGLPRLSRSASIEGGTEFRFEDPEKFHFVQSLLRSDAVKTLSWREADQALFFALTLEKIVMSIFLSLACLITSFSIVTVIALLITQKRKDIGLLMALGLSLQETKRLFVRISFLLASVGMMGGFSVGVLVSFLIDRYPIEIMPDIYYDAVIPAEMDPMILLLVFFGAVVVTWIASVLPAKMSTRWNPSEALR